MTTSSPAWRKSSYSGSSGDCVEVATVDSGLVLMRNSNHPDAGTLSVDPASMCDWVRAAKAGALDDLTR